MAIPGDFSFGGTVPENYERFFVPAIGRPLAEVLIAEAGLSPGERVLDVGCGTGVVARLAVERVGDDGEVAGLDVNPGMLAVAASASPDTGIAWHEASADAMPLEDGAFDVVLCQLSLQFMPDRDGALREMHRVLAPGGRVVLNVPGPADPLFEAMADAMGRHVAPQAAGFVRAVFSLHDRPAIENLLRDAGFRDVRSDAYTHDGVLPAGRDFLWQYIASTPLSALVAGGTHDARSALEDEVLAEWAPFAEGDGLAYHQRIVMATAGR